MAKDAVYQPEVRSQKVSAGLMFRLAQAQDSLFLAKLTAERHPSADWDETVRVSRREIGLNDTERRYRVFVVEEDGVLKGFCRLYHSQEVPADKRKHDSPQGWYCMGVIVEQAHRRQGIAMFLTRGRFEWLMGQGAEGVYSSASGHNLSSIAMHKKLGYRQVGEVAGVLGITFEEGWGHLFFKDLSS